MHSVSKRRRLSPNMVIDDKKKYPVNRDFVVCEGLYEKCFSKFNEMRSNQQLCDVKLKTKNGDIIWAHKVVLAANSEYFNIMFNGQFKESRVAEIVIQQLDVFILNLLIDFIYTSKLFISEQNIHEILNGICLLQFNEQVQNQCFNYIKTRVNPNNCLGIKEITEHLGLQELCSFCLKYIFILYRKVIEHDEFVFITFEEILQIIKSEELCVSEELVYKSVLKWTVHDLANRTKHLPVLLNYVRLLNISTSFMKSITQKEPFLKLNSKCVKYLSKAFALQQENNAILNLTYSISIPFRPNYSEYILILNKVGENNNRSLLFNAISKKWKYIDLRFPSIPSIASYVLNDSRIIHLAGCQLLNSQTNAVLRPYFDDYSKAVIQELGDRKVNLTTTTPMNEIHNENNIVQIGSKIYVVCYYNSEYYDIVEDKWFKMKCSTNVRTSCSVIAFGGYIYAVRD
ncbi:Hypothetical protein CINCED_3A012742 [Cinara cedri]|uniref:BTB domain-containing protein n=1 Tax=Cinara cedri TaxID=506608 RepID=A0A5E4M0N6_9HEMI|nr:Hypothetical protein CINCED_3A012742 [Cinara cedri]